MLRVQRGYTMWWRWDAPPTTAEGSRAEVWRNCSGNHAASESTDSPESISCASLDLCGIVLSLSLSLSLRLFTFLPLYLFLLSLSLSLPLSLSLDLVLVSSVDGRREMQPKWRTPWVSLATVNRATIHLDISSAKNRAALLLFWELSWV